MLRIRSFVMALNKVSLIAIMRIMILMIDNDDYSWIILMIFICDDFPDHDMLMIISCNHDLVDVLSVKRDLALEYD